MCFSYIFYDLVSDFVMDRKLEQTVNHNFGITFGKSATNTLKCFGKITAPELCDLRTASVYIDF